MEFDPARISARAVCERLVEAGILSKDTHDTVVRFAPPLTIDARQIDEALGLIAGAFHALEREERTLEIA